MSLVIDVQNVSKHFGKATAVNQVSFGVEKGQIFGLLGPNGAGKTTTIRMINHILNPDTGHISILGEAVSPKSQERIGYLPEERGLYKKMKVFDQLMYLAQLKGLSQTAAKTAIEFWLDRFEASSWKKKEVSELSKGMSQKIQFIATVAHDPEIYIFDEPFSGLDPINSEMLKEVILEEKNRGKTILFSTHRMEQVEQMCDDICLFNQGKAVLQGNLQSIKQSFGNNTVLLDFIGDSEFLNQLEGVRVNNRSTNFAEIRLLEGASPQHILEIAMKHAEIQRFEIVQPSLQDIFISTVNDTKVAV
ncbi:MAG: ABC transporter [Rhodothermaeota bacterium MED-G12]|nr:ABC transporter [Balneola sp.]PDH57017.1 MAG: ABC transporter [Rhodothermaeota bacterium MED-G12]CAI8355962.1 MAG: ABC transporter ATP-binding protein NatA [Rhodothermaeota bacterium MED-G12]|tara:strand:+ start:6325 stop:7236 length:912 start_codon:yes stop_codon:yes gene_type:complete